jgi:hypothetical protein
VQKSVFLAAQKAREAIDNGVGAPEGQHLLLDAVRFDGQGQLPSDALGEKASRLPRHSRSCAIFTIRCVTFATSSSPAFSA